MLAFTTRGGKKVLYKLYNLYAVGRDSLGVVFRQHRTFAAFKRLRQEGVLSAWKQAYIDNSKAGNPYLPAFVKTFLEVLGVVLLAGYGLKRWRVFAVIGLLALSLTASGGPNNNVINCNWTSFNTNYDVSEALRVPGDPNLNDTDPQSAWDAVVVLEPVASVSGNYGIPYSGQWYPAYASGTYQQYCPGGFKGPVGVVIGPYDITFIGYDSQGNQVQLGATSATPTTREELGDKIPLVIPPW